MPATKTTPSGSGSGKQSTAKATAARAKTAKGQEQRAQQARRASILLKHVSDPTRLQVILLLSEGERHVGALCDQLSQSQPAVSHHLALLRHGGIIAPRRQGKNNFYSLTDAGTQLAGVVQNLIP
jgi:DNA-binding transcriptional ArsR family regulator